MEVRPKRNKPFECDQCGEEIDTKKEDYNKIILVTFVGNKKFRNKFCSLECLEKWKILNKKPSTNQAPLEVELKKMTTEEKEAYKEEEEPKATSKKDKEKERKSAQYSEPAKKNYEEVKEINVPTQTETLNLIKKEGLDKVRYPGNFDREGSVQKYTKYTPMRSLKKFLDVFNVFKTKYDRSEYEKNKK